jgi:RND superfamily putative drug exporter
VFEERKMFTRLARFTGKYRIIITIFWLVAAIVLFLVSPTLAEVGVTDESQFLPQDTESAEASRLLKEKFPSTTKISEGSGTIIFYNEQGITDTDLQEGKAIRDWLLSNSAPEVVENVTSIYDAEALRSTLISNDQTTMLMLVDFSVTPLSDAAKEAVTQIRDYIQSDYPDADIYLTGEIGFFQDLFASVLKTIDRTTIVTVILVAVLLLIIYRSPVAIFLPLFAIGCSFAVARGILGYIGAAGMDISTLADAYLVVVIFGIGTDYCLFIVSRFREELVKRERHEAQMFTMRHIGPVIAASALTVIVAFLSLGISRFGMTKTTGYALAIGVAITLVAGLTLVPALMSIFGKYLFWPAKLTSTAHRERRFGWSKIGNWVSRHPIYFAVPIIIILVVPYLALFHLERSADIINQMPKSVESVQGYKVMTEHFQMGEFSPLYLLIESPQGRITNPSTLQEIDDVAQSLQNVSGVSRIDYYAAPSSQLSGLATQVRSLGDMLGTGSGLDKISLLQTSGQLIQKMTMQYPGILQSQNFQQVETNLTSISSLASQIYTTKPEDLPVLIGQLQGIIYSLADNLDGLVSEFRLETNSPFSAYLLSTYFSTDETIARINIILSRDPYSPETVDTVAQLRKSVKEITSTSDLKASSHYIGGQSAIQADIIFTNDADFGKVTGLATAGILIVIIILLRSLLAPFYMVLTVLLNYGATLGIATWLFLDVLGQSSMIYMLPIFIFVVLVALGADYNIFLVSRIRGEAQQKPIKEAVSQAVAHTGGVITACGIILAGTFATLTTSPLQVVLQIGGAIAVGILVDTFIVRALLIPALATLAGRWSWWPSRLGKH